jgi:hypothetical protein
MSHPAAREPASPAGSTSLTLRSRTETCAYDTFWSGIMKNQGAPSQRLITAADQLLSQLSFFI